MEATVALLLAWISAQTGLSIPPPPRIVHLDSSTLNELATAPGSQMERVRALYGRGEWAVYLRTNWDATELRDRSELIHELVHHYQTFHGLTYECDAARETLAYDLQIGWLREQGVADPYDFLQTNALFIFMVSVCRDPHHD